MVNWYLIVVYDSYVSLFNGYDDIVWMLGCYWLIGG